MKSELMELARAALQLALKRGAQGARVRAASSRESRVEWRDSKLDRIRESTRRSLSVTLFVDGRYSSNQTSDLRPDAIERFMDESMAMTRTLAVDPDRVLPDPALYEGRTEADLRLLDPAVSGVLADDRRRTAAALEEAARSAPGADQIISVTSSCGDTLSKEALVTSNGMEGSQAKSSFALSARVAVRDSGGRKPSGRWYASARHRARLPDVEQVGKEATRRALMLVGSGPVDTARYPCIIENVAVERLLRTLWRPLMGHNIQQLRSFLVEKLGQVVASDLLSITDQPHLVEGLGSLSYDPEGMCTSPRPIIEKGRLSSYYLDTYYARKLKTEPTSATSTNLVFATGERDLDALMAELNAGILVTGLVGGNSNDATGDFSFGVRGQWIEKGLPVKAVSEMNLSGNHMEVWRRLIEPGSDPHPYSPAMCPSLRFDDLQFSGV